METRDAKHLPRTLTEQRQAWLIQAGEVLGGPQAVQHTVHTALHPDPVAGTRVSAEWAEGGAGRVLAAMEERRSSWQTWHVRAEAQRQVRAVELPAEQSERLVDLLVGEVLGNLSVWLARPYLTWRLIHPRSGRYAPWLLPWFLLVDLVEMAGVVRGSLRNGTLVL